MARITVEDCLEMEPNRFALVILAARRAKDILAGSPVLVQDPENKAVVLALREIADGRVRFQTEEEFQAYNDRKATTTPSVFPGLSPSLASPFNFGAAQKEEGNSVLSSQLDELEKLFNLSPEDEADDLAADLAASEAKKKAASAEVADEDEISE